MSVPKLLYSKDEIDFELGYRYRYIYGSASDGKSILHTHDYYEIFITVSDNILHLVNNSSVLLPKNTCVFIRPNDIHHYDFSDNNDFGYINITLSVQTITEFFTYLSSGFQAEKLISEKMPPSVTLTEKEASDIFNTLRLIDTTNWDNQKTKKLKMRIALIGIFEKFIRVNVIDNISLSPPSWLLEFTKKMYREENLNKSADEIVKLSDKSRAYLSRSVKKYYNKTFSEFVNDIRLDYASNRLESGNAYSIIDLCYECGFNNLGYFYRLFSKKYGVPPKKFQNLNSN